MAVSRSALGSSAKPRQKAGPAWTARRDDGTRYKSARAVRVVALAFAVVFVGATLPTPLYPLYRSAFSFGGVTLTLIYAV